MNAMRHVIAVALLLVNGVSSNAPGGHAWRGFARRLTGGSVEVGVSLGGALLLKEYVLDARYIPSESMLPTFAVGDLLLLDKVSHRMRPLARGDVVCFTPPPALVRMIPALGRRNLCCIKRIVAIEGDEVCVRRGKLYINGEAQAEPYIAEPQMSYRTRPVIVPPDHLFVLGDNREHSVDSHCWGCLPRDLVLGVPLCRYWPPARHTFFRRAAANFDQRAPQARQAPTVVVV